MIDVYSFLFLAFPINLRTRLKMGFSSNEKMKNETYAKESFWKHGPHKSREIGERKTRADVPKRYPDKKERDVKILLHCKNNVQLC
jgi:hypothetical protein